MAWTRRKTKLLLSMILAAHLRYFHSGSGAKEWVEVKATNGDTHLGGDDIDQRVQDWIVSEFKKENGIDLSQDKMALQRLKEAAEKAKVELSTMMETEINLPFITADATGPKTFANENYRAKLEQLAEDLVKRSLPPSNRPFRMLA